MRLFIIILAFFLSSDLAAQYKLPYDSTAKLVVLKGTKPVDVRCKKKIMKAVHQWVNEKQVYPPLVMSTIHQSKHSIITKGVFEVPSKKGIHPLSFKLELTVGKKSIYYRFDNFYFEDISLSLEEWLKKYAEGNERNRENANMVGKELDSYVFLSLQLLQNKINDQ